LGTITDTVNPDQASFAMEEGVDYRLIRDDNGDCFVEFGNLWIYHVNIAHSGVLDIKKNDIVSYNEVIAYLKTDSITQVYQDYIDEHYERIDFDIQVVDASGNSIDLTGYEFDYIVENTNHVFTVDGVVFEPDKIKLTKSDVTNYVRMSVFWANNLPSSLVTVAPNLLLTVYRSYDYKFLIDVETDAITTNTRTVMVARQIGDQYRKLITTFNSDLPTNVTEIRVSRIKTDSILYSLEGRPLPPVVYADHVYRDRKVIEANFGSAIDYGNIRTSMDQRILTLALNDPEWLNQEFGKDHITFGGMELARAEKDKIIGIQLSTERELRQLELYKLRVNALWFALWNGPSEFDLNIGASVFLGLPISELNGKIIEVGTNYRVVSDGSRTIKYTVSNGVEFDEKFYLGAEVMLFEPLAKSAARVYDINIDEHEFQNTLTGMYDAFVSARGSERSLLFDLDDLFFDMNPPCEQLFFDAKDDCDPNYRTMTTEEYYRAYAKDVDVLNGTFYFDEDKITPCCSRGGTSEFPDDFYKNFRYLFVVDILGGVEYEYENLQGLSEFLKRIKPTYANFILNRNIPVIENLGFNDDLRLIRPHCDFYSERMLFNDDNEYYDAEETSCSCGEVFDSGEGYESFSDPDRSVANCGWRPIGNADISNRFPLPVDLAFIEAYPNGFATTVSEVVSNRRIVTTDTPLVPYPDYLVVQIVSGDIRGLCIQVDTVLLNELTLKFEFNTREIQPNTQIVVWLDRAIDQFNALDDNVKFTDECDLLDFHEASSGDNPDVITAELSGMPPIVTAPTYIYAGEYDSINNPGFSEMYLYGTKIVPGVTFSIPYSGMETIVNPTISGYVNHYDTLWDWTGDGAPISLVPPSYVDSVVVNTVSKTIDVVFNNNILTTQGGLETVIGSTGDDFAFWPLLTADNSVDPNFRMFPEFGSAAPSVLRGYFNSDRGDYTTGLRTVAAKFGKNTGIYIVPFTIPYVDGSSGAFNYNPAIIPDIDIIDFQEDDVFVWATLDITGGDITVNLELGIDIDVIDNTTFNLIVDTSLVDYSSESVRHYWGNIMIPGDPPAFPGQAIDSYINIDLIFE